MWFKLCLEFCLGRFGLSGASLGAMASFSSFENYAIGVDDLTKLFALGLEGPEDLAFAFTRFEEAEALGVGAAWTAVRRDAKAFAHTACVQWRGCKPSTVHGQSGKVTPTSNVTPKAEAEAGAGQADVKAGDVKPRSRAQKRLRPSRGSG